MIDSKGRIDTNLVALLLISPIRPQLKNNLLTKFLPQLDLKGANPTSSTIKRSIHIILRIQMFKDNLIPKGNVLASFFGDYGFELLLLGFGTWQGLLLF
jgi:hypothetical protein